MNTACNALPTQLNTNSFTLRSLPKSPVDLLVHIVVGGSFAMHQKLSADFVTHNDSCGTCQ